MSTRPISSNIMWITRMSAEILNFYFLRSLKKYPYEVTDG